MKIPGVIIFVMLICILVPFTCAVILAANSRFELSVVNLFLFLIGPAVLTLLSCKLLSRFNIQFSTRQRISAVVSAGFFGGVFAYWLFFHPFFGYEVGNFLTLPAKIITSILVTCSAVLGGVIASGLERGFWEDNYPPSHMIRDEVEHAHLKFHLGKKTGYPSKSVFDRLTAFFTIILFSPLWLLITFVIWFEDPGPVLFIKNSVTKNGCSFRQFKFRTMSQDAEANTGPIFAAEEDLRVLRFGKLLRKTALDEFPQLLNILLGEMSFVGPRPQRTVLVHNYLQVLPKYAERHAVLPGLAGLAQVVGDYYITPRQKLRLDTLYIQHMSLGFDLKLLLLSFLITLWFRWKPGWNGRVPRNLLRFGSS